MSDQQGSARLSLPYLQPGQAQKEMTHNAALALLDIAVQASVIGVGIDGPPAAPTIGASWIVGTHPTGDWTGHAGAIAGWTASGWRFVAPFEGLAAWSIADGQVARRAGGAWAVGTLAGSALTIGGKTVVGPRRPAIATPAGGGTIDAEARAAVAAILAALRGHGLIDV